MKRMWHSFTSVPFATGDCMALDWSNGFQTSSSTVCSSITPAVSSVQFNSRTPKAPTAFIWPLTLNQQISLHSSCQTEMFPALNYFI